MTGKAALRGVHYLLLTLFCLFAFVPGITTVPPTDRDESRFVQSTKQMVESGDYVDIRLQDEPRYKKPIGIYWLQAAAVLISGEGADAPIAVYRSVSVLGATLSVLTAAWLGARMFGTVAGLISGLALAGTLMLGFEARIAKTDAMLLLTAIVAQTALASLYLGHKQGTGARGAAWVFWAAQGAGILIKGPITPLVSLLTIAALLVFDRDRAWLRRLRIGWGLLLAFVIALPWLGLITWKSGAAFWEEAVGRDLLGKVGSGQESHGFPPGYYFLLFSVFFWPFALPAVRAGLAALGRWRADPRLLFCLAWYLPFWIVIEIMPTKLPHYLLPAYPALAVLMGGALAGTGTLAGAAFGADRLGGWKRWVEWAATAGVVIVTIGLALLAVGIQPYTTGAFSGWGLAAAVLILLAGWLGSGMALRMTPLPRTALASGAAVAAFGVLTLAVIPAITPMWLSPQIAAEFERVKPCPASRLLSAGHHEPSLVFLTATNTLLTDGGTAAAEMAKDACAVASIADDQLDLFRTHLRGLAVTEAGRVAGLNYSKGSERAFVLFVRAR